MPTVDEQARTLYEAVDTAKPAWNDLGENTKNVWRSYVNRDKDWPFLYTGGNKAAEDAREKILAKNVTFPPPAEGWGTIEKPTVVTFDAPLGEPQYTPASLHEESRHNIDVEDLEDGIVDEPVSVTTLEAPLAEISGSAGGSMTMPQPPMQVPKKGMSLKEKLALKGLK